jgi:hypothetical protein
MASGLLYHVVYLVGAGMCLACSAVNFHSLLADTGRHPPPHLMDWMARALVILHVPLVGLAAVGVAAHARKRYLRRFRNNPLQRRAPPVQASDMDGSDDDDAAEMVSFTRV